MTPAACGPVDYARAWREVAAPAWQALAPSVQALYTLTGEKAAALHQNIDLDMPWPDDGTRQTFEAIPTPELAHFARTVHALGHWRPSKEPLASQLLGEATSAHWKASNYADQVLSARLGLIRNRACDQRLRSFSVHEGYLRVGFNTHNVWQWQELGEATLTLLTDARARVPAPQYYFESYSEAKREANDSASDRFYQVCHAIQGERSVRERAWFGIGERFTIVSGADASEATS